MDAPKRTVASLPARHPVTKLPPSKRARARVGTIIEEPNGCHRWTGSHFRSGYAQASVAGKNWRVHRYTYIRDFGPVPAGLVLDHFACDNRWCVNPAHVRPVTPRENTNRGRTRKYTDEQRAEIQLAFAAGEGIRAIARRLGIPFTSVRHIVHLRDSRSERASCVERRVQRASERAEAHAMPA
jgi:hypothetical protein